MRLLSIPSTRASFDRALALDPDNIGALVNVAFVEFAAVATFYPQDMASRLAAAERAAARALSLSPENARAHECMGCILGLTGRTERAIVECERALTLDPNLAQAHATIGWCKAITGRGKETEAHIQEALRLSPRDMGGRNGC